MSNLTTGVETHTITLVESQKTIIEQQVKYLISPPATSQDLNTLFINAWADFQPRDFTPVLNRSLGYVCAYRDDRLVGFVNVAWDGGQHAFLLDTTVHENMQHQGIGRELVRQAGEIARQAGAEWLHVDYEEHLSEFYEKCGFENTKAGLIRLRDEEGKRTT